MSVDETGAPAAALAPASASHAGGHQAVPTRGRANVPANLFGIPLGIAGLAQCWDVAHHSGLVAGWTASVLWLLTAALWLVVLVAFVAIAVSRHRFASQPADPTLGPFTSVAFLVPMMLSLPLVDRSPSAGHWLYVVSVVAGVMYGGWLTGQWVITDLRLEQFHPGYYLPTVATGLVAAAVSARMGHEVIAVVLFGYGALGWVAVASMMWARVFVSGPLPVALVPTLAIQLAPPVVAGNAWFAINGHRIDRTALLLAGYAVLMALVQLRLVPVYARLRFAAGWWAFAFSYAAGVVDAMQWVVVSGMPHRSLWLVAMLVVVTAAMAALVARSLVGLAAGTFLPRDPVGQSAGASERTVAVSSRASDSAS